MPETKKVELKKTNRISMSEFLNPDKKERRTLTPFEKYIQELCAGGKKK